MEDGFLKLSCLLAVSESSPKSTVVVAHEGGSVDGEDWFVVELDHYDGSAEDLFDEHFGFCDPGLHVWSGEMKPVWDDAPEYRNSETRPATGEDIKRFLKI